MTPEDVRRIFCYEPETGLLCWKISPSRIAKVGDICGGPTGTGHLRFQFKGRTYAVHRVAWAYVHGYWPKDEIDHINQIKNDNRIVNLREATFAQNQHNRTKYKNNKTGLKCVSFLKKLNKWKAVIRVDGKQIYLGLFECPAAAHFSYQVAADNYFGTFAGVF